jgi:hypothetical protein
MVRRSPSTFEDVIPFETIKEVFIMKAVTLIMAVTAYYFIIVNELQ